MATDQTEIIEFLSHGESYGQAGVTPERIETHASVVFLVGDRVYKLKRAVRYSYLDYSSVAARERFCRAEIELNRRTAPSLYLGIRAVTRKSGGGFELGGKGAVVDWLVEMRRFDESALFDRLAEEDRLTPLLMRQLADAVAAFHATAEKTPGFGGRVEIANVIADNHSNLMLGCPPLVESSVEALRVASNAALDRVGMVLEERRIQGKVRRCHGDLHLRNICLFEGAPTLFDCIEFSNSLACIDVLYDLAFLLMDLEHRLLRGPANAVFNRYLDRTADASGLPALPLFLSVRAAVRAKVALASLAQHAQDSTAAEARTYLALASALLSPGQPCLIAIGGLSGSGKLTIAAALAPDFLPRPGARIVRSDVLRKSMMGVAPETKLPASAYDQATSDKVYLALGEEAAMAIAAGYTAIVDAAFLAERERKAIAAVARRAGAPFSGLWLAAPEKTLIERIAQRHADASDADRGVLMQQLKIDTGFVDWRRVAPSNDVGDHLAAARQALGDALRI